MSFKEFCSVSGDTLNPSCHTDSAGSASRVLGQLEGAAWQVVGAAEGSIPFCGGAASHGFQLGRTELQHSGSGQGDPGVGTFGAR